MIRSVAFVLLAAVFGIGFSHAQSISNTDPDAARIVTSDIELFWRAYDKATPANNLTVFRDEYLLKGSQGLKDFTSLRIENSCELVAVVEYAPKYYAALRGPSLKVASYESKIRESFRRLKKIYPPAVFPDIYFVIGRMNSAGTTSRSGLLIGVDMFGKNSGAPIEELGDWHRAVIGSTDRLPYIVAHELIHYEQQSVAGDTLLARSLREGVADFIAELIAGDTINPHLHKFGDPIEQQLWLEFKKEMEGKNVGNWLYQGEKAKDRPADLGYYMGYKIAQSYYKNHADKRMAVSEILRIQDYKKFLADSRYEQKFAAE